MYVVPHTGGSPPEISPPTTNHHLRVDLIGHVEAEGITGPLPIHTNIHFKTFYTYIALHTMPATWLVAAYSGAFEKNFVISLPPSTSINTVCMYVCMYIYVCIKECE